MKMRLFEIELLKNCLVSVGEVIDEMNLEVSPDGIEVVEPDGTNVSAVRLTLLPSLFDEYHVSEKETVGLNVGGLLKVLKRADNDSVLNIERVETKIKLGITSSDGVTRNFFVPILDLGEKERPPIDELSFKAKAEVKTATIKRILEDVETVSDIAVFDIDDTALEINSVGDMTSTETKIHRDTEVIRELTAQGRSKAKYPIEYLKKIFKHKGSDWVTLEFATDYPLRIGFTYIDQAILNFFLAPRVEQ